MTAPHARTSTSARILEVLRQVTGDEAVLSEPDLELYGTGLLDSLATVTLLVEFEDTFGLTIPPSDLDRAAWATPRRLVADVERRLADAGIAR